MSETIANNKRIAKNTLILYFRMLLLMVVSLYTSRIVLQALGSEDYGLNNVIAGVIAMFGYLNNSLATSTSRFLTFELGKGNLKRIGEIFNNSFGIHFGYAIILIVLSETIGLWFVNNVLNIPDNRIVACNIVYQTVIISAVLQITLVPRNAMIIAHERMTVYAYIGIYGAFVKCFIAIALKYSSYDRLIIYAILLLLNEIIIYLFYWIYCRKAFPAVTKLSLKYSKVLIRSLLGFTTWSLLGSTVLMARNQGVTMLINLFFGAAVNAANAIAYQVNQAITNFTTNFTVALNPQIIKTYAADDMKSMKNLLYQGCKLSFYLLLLLCYPVLFETEYILHMWLGEYPAYTVNFTRWILILSMVEIFNNPIGCAIQATGDIKWYQIVISCIQFLTFPAVFIFYKMSMPPYIALVAMVVFGLIAFFSRFYFMKKLLYIKTWEYISIVLLPCLLVSLLAIIIPSVIKLLMSESIMRLTIATTLCTIINMILIYTLGINNRERLFLKQAIFKFFHRY